VPMYRVPHCLDFISKAEG